MRRNFNVNLNGWLDVSVHQGDITAEEVDAITNAANSYLRHGGGVAGAILKKAGQIIQIESDNHIRTYGQVPPGEVAVTNAGKMENIKIIIHAVGPIW